MTTRSQSGVVYVNPNVFVDGKLQNTPEKRRCCKIGTFFCCCAILVVISLILIIAALGYLHFRERHLGCYTPTNDKICYSNLKDSEKYRAFATKTNYNDTVQMAKDEYDKPYKIDGCKPVLFYLFQRHTTRYPDREHIEQSKVKLEELVTKIIHSDKTRLCEKDIEELQTWFYPFVPDLDNMVTPDGVRITSEQVRRLSKRFPEVFHEARPFEGGEIQVDFTSRVRSQDTAYAFLKEWFTKDVFSNRIKKLISGNKNDTLLQFHRSCSELLKKRGRNVKEAPEVVTLEKSSYYSTLLETLETRLGIPVSYADMKAMYAQCEYENSIVGDSPWCAVFTNEDLKLLEFREDLDDYYKDAYGNDRNWKQACFVGNDLFEYLTIVDSPSHSPKYPLTVLHFSHAGAIKKVMAYFKLGFGPKITWDGLCSKRDWRSSHLAPFNANILFVVHSCRDNVKTVSTFVNEKLVHLPGCSSRQCPLEEFRSEFQRSEIRCDLNEICV